MNILSNTFAPFVTTTWGSAMIQERILYEGITFIATAAGRSWEMTSNERVDQLCEKYEEVKPHDD